MTLDKPYGGGQVRNYDQEVAAGRIPGVSNKTIYARSEFLGADQKEAWNVDADFVFNFAATGEEWEAVSDSAEDNPLGIGIGTIRVPYIDTNFVEQSQDVILNGTTPVAITGTDKIFPDDTFATQVNIAGNRAVGEITVRKVASDIRAVILPNSTISRNGFALVPAGETWYLTGAVVNSGKGGDVLFILEITTGQDGVFIERPEFQQYQNSSQLDELSDPIIEKSIIRVLGSSSNENTLGFASLTFRREINK